jgi:Ca2+-binding EF-hand superfamily protein
MSHKPTDQQLEDAINAVFGKYDVDKSDSLDFGEVKNLITDAFSKLNEEDVKKFAMAVDKNSDGKITRAELFAIFKQIIEKKHAGH